MRRRHVGVLLVVALLAAGVAGVAVAQEESSFIRGEPGIDVYAPESTLTAASTDELVLQVANDGEVRAGAAPQRDLVTTARAVTVEVTDEGPFEVHTRRQSVGTVPDGAVAPVPLSVTVPEDVEPGEYDVDVRVRYSHTSLYSPAGNVVQERSRTVRTSIDVTVEDRPRFTVDTVESDVQVGDSGSLVTNVTNVGSEAARDVVVGLESRSTDVSFGDAPRNTARIERLDPGENATIAHRVTVREDVDVRDLALDASVEYTDTDGVAGVQEGLTAGVVPAGEQSFSVSITSSTLRVGEVGAIEGTVRNDGPVDVDAVRLALGDARIEPRTDSYAVGSLAAGESATFRFRGTVPPGTDPVPQRLDVTTQYRTAAGNDRATVDPVRVDVAERRDALDVDAVNASFAAGESGTLRVDVTNRREVDVRDVRLTLDVADPLESDFRSTVVPALAPGESEVVAFDLEVDGDAPASRYPATVGVEYIDPDDETVTARPATLAVEVTEATDDGLPAIEVVIFGALAVLVAVVFVWLYRR